MDPNATLASLIDAARDGDADVVEALSMALVEWLRQGGFPPDAVRQDFVEARVVPEFIMEGAENGRDWFVAYRRVGFTEEQAMALVTRAIYNAPPPPQPAPRRWWQR
jgi:hypothetical protein